MKTLVLGSSLLKLQVVLCLLCQWPWYGNTNNQQLCPFIFFVGWTTWLEKKQRKPYDRIAVPELTIEDLKMHLDP
jgi:hypothetical protein